MKEGKTVSKDRYSGLERSGAVQTRKWPSESSMPNSERRGGRGIRSSSSSSAWTGEVKSSTLPPAEGTVAPDDWVDAECDSGGISRNGSLGARARFDCAVTAIGVACASLLDSKGWDRQRECAAEGCCDPHPLLILARGTSSNARTYENSALVNVLETWRSENRTPLSTSMASSMKSLPLVEKKALDVMFLNREKKGGPLKGRGGHIRCLFEHGVIKLPPNATWPCTPQSLRQYL